LRLRPSAFALENGVPIGKSVPIAQDERLFALVEGMLSEAATAEAVAAATASEGKIDDVRLAHGATCSRLMPHRGDAAVTSQIPNRR